MSSDQGAAAIVQTLEALGVKEIFGVVGTQNVELFEAFRRSPVRVIAATHELAAGFMANGAYRATGRPGVLVTIPGPGLTYAVPALAEARADSAAVLHIAGEPTEKTDKKFQLQDIPQRAMVEPLVKAFLVVERVEDLTATIARGYAMASDGEPGPVVVQVRRSVLTAEAPASRIGPGERSAPLDESSLAEVRSLLTSARRIAWIAGQGAQEHGQALARLAERLQSPIFLTTSGRGAVDEARANVIPFDRAVGGWDAVNAVLDEADAVVALGVKFSHNGSGGYRLKLTPGKLVHVDTSREVLNQNYPAKCAVQGDAGVFLAWCEKALTQPNGGWSAIDWDARRSSLLTSAAGGSLVDDEVEPRFVDCAPPTAARFFAALRRALPKEGIVVTDSGLHQFLVRKHFTVNCERGLLTPTDFQSMGFAIPAATAAKLAFPRKPVVVILGDAGFAMAGLELLVNLREQLPLTVIVFNDGHDGMIRLKQMQQYGSAFATSLVNPDFGKLAESLGVAYVKLAGDPEPVLRAAIRSDKLTLIEARLIDGPGLTAVKLKSFAKDALRSIGGGAILDSIRNLGKHREPSP